MAGKRRQNERAEQIALICWFRLRYPADLLFAIPNGGSRNPLEAYNLKREGVTSGIPDLFLAVARGEHHGMFIEMKRTMGGTLSMNQIEKARLLQEKGYLTVCAHGADQAKIYIEGYMGKSPWTAVTQAENK